MAENTDYSVPPTGLAFSTDGRLVAVCCGDTIRVFECHSGDELCRMPVVGAEATAVTWVAPGLFVSGWSTGILMVARIDRPDPKDVRLPADVTTV